MPTHPRESRRGTRSRVVAPWGLIALALAAPLSGCATRSSVRDVDVRVQQMAKDVAALRRDQDATVRDTSALTIELQTIGARLRETDTRLREVANRLASLGNRIAAAETSLRELSGNVETLARTPPASLSTTPPRAPNERSAAAEQAFGAALKVFSTGEHGQAVLELTDFIAKYPGHPLTARAQLWIGEAYLRQRDYRQAILELRKAIDAAPDPSVAADAWLRIGHAYTALRERPSATAAWQRVVREYPESEAASRARTLLRR